MPYVIPAQRMAFFFSPKSGGTSLRAFLFHVENGFPFQDYVVQGRKFDANTLTSNMRFNWFDHKATRGYRYFSLVRDPIKRFLSGYSNRVLHYRELSIERAGENLLREGLPPDPDIATFVENYEGYVKCSKSVGRHFLPQQKFVSERRGLFERVFKLEEVKSLVDFVNTECGTKAVMPRLQTGGPKFDFFELDDYLQESIFQICQHDIAFRLFPEYLTPYAHLTNPDAEAGSPLSYRASG